jgi:hypothetical protein
MAPILPGAPDPIGSRGRSFATMAYDPRPTWRGSRVEEDTMGKTGRKRRARKKKGANHGKRPNA